MADRSIVHRDIKPGNIVLRHSDHTPVLVDFGLAVNTATYANDGSVAGTPYFMCPEALQAKAPSPAFDAYSLGVTYCTLLLEGQYVGPFDRNAIIDLKRDGRFESALLNGIEKKNETRLIPYLQRLVDRDSNERIRTVQKLVEATSMSTKRRWWQFWK
jgi:serine/threonine protein kinase